MSTEKEKQIKKQINEVNNMINDLAEKIGEKIISIKNNSSINGSNDKIQEDVNDIDEYTSEIHRSAEDKRDLEMDLFHLENLEVH